MIKFMLTAVFLTVLTGCTTSGPVKSIAPGDSAGESTSELVVIRVDKALASMNTFYVRLDGEDIFTLNIGQYTKLTIPPGKHTISVKCFGWFPTWREDFESFTVQPNEIVYFETSPSWSCSLIDPISPEAAKEKMRRLVVHMLIGRDPKALQQLDQWGTIGETLLEEIIKTNY